MRLARRPRYLLGSTPQLTGLQDNGGATLTHGLYPSSPAIDAGDPNACPATDQRGVARPQGAACDIGAYEYVTPPSAPPTEPPTEAPPPPDPATEPPTSGPTPKPKPSASASPSPAPNPSASCADATSTTDAGRSSPCRRPGGGRGGCRRRRLADGGRSGRRWCTGPHRQCGRRRILLASQAAEQAPLAPTGVTILSADVL